MKSRHLFFGTAVGLLLSHLSAGAQQQSVPPNWQSGNAPNAQDQGNGQFQPGQRRRWQQQNSDGNQFGGPRGVWRPQNGAGRPQNGASTGSNGIGLGSGPGNGAGFRQGGGNGQGLQQNSQGGAGQNDRSEQARKRMLERFDTNHDGKLDENERARMKEFMQQRRQMRQRDGGQGGGGLRGQRSSNTPSNNPADNGRLPAPLQE
jgi:hypothetical protein